jgi:hypothetical protein
MLSMDINGVERSFQSREMRLTSLAFPSKSFFIASPS